MKFITGRARGPLETRARLMKDLKHHRDHGFGLCIVEWRDTGEVIGRCGLEPRPRRNGMEGELAWMFAQPWWGRGLATEAGAALIPFGSGARTAEDFRHGRLPKPGFDPSHAEAGDDSRAEE